MMAFSIGMTLHFHMDAVLLARLFDALLLRHKGDIRGNGTDPTGTSKISFAIDLLTGEQITG
jgi:hypothetical protein